MSPEDERIPDDEDGEEFAPRSIFAAGWFRAVLVLTVLAIVVVIALPYLLDWFEPTTSVKPPARSEVAVPAAPSPGVPAPAPVASTTPAPVPPPVAPVAPPSAPAPQPSPAPAAAPQPPAKPQVKPAPAPAPAPPAPAPPAKMTPPPATAQSKPAPAPSPSAPAPAKEGAAAAARPRPAPSPAMAAKQKPASTAMKLPEATTRTAAAKSAQISPAVGDPARAYWVQVGLFTDPKNAAGLAEKLRADGFTVEVATVTRAATSSGPAAGTYQIVRAGSYPNEQGAVAARDRLRGKGYDGFLTQGAAK